MVRVVKKFGVQNVKLEKLQKGVAAVFEELSVGAERGSEPKRKDE